MTERFTLPGRLDSSGAPALVQALLARRGRPLVLDAAGVEVIGARAIEVLIAAGRQWAADGQAMAIDAPSDRYRAACTALGLSPEAPWCADDTAGQGLAA
jgi:chemotaxis protein CheX